MALFSTLRAGHGNYLWLILVLGGSLRLAAILAFNHTLEGDELAYQAMAVNLVAGRGIVDNMNNLAMYNMGYPAFILAPVFSIFGHGLFMARLANLILGEIGIFLCYLVAKEAGANRWGQYLAATLWAVYLPSSIYGVYLFKENLMIPLMLGVIWCGLRLSKTASITTAISCGGLFGLLALTGNAALSLAGPTALAVFFNPATLRQRIKLSGVILITSILVVSPWLLRNIQAIGTPVLNTNGGFNLYLGNNPQATGWFISIGDTPRGPTWEALRKTGEVNASETLKKEAITWIKTHPAAFISLALHKVVYFWTPPFHEGKETPSTMESIARAIWIAEFIGLVVFGVVGLRFAIPHWQPLAILWCGIACYTAVHMLFYVIFRYREPIMPIVVIVAALGCEAIYGYWLAKRAAIS